MTKVTKSSVELGAIVRKGFSASSLKRADVARQIGVNASYIGNIARVGWIPSQEVVEKLISILHLPEEATLLAAGYSNAEIKRGYRRYVDAVRENRPVDVREEAKDSVKAAPLSSQALLNALSSLVSEHSALKNEVESLTNDKQVLENKVAFAKKALASL